MITAWISDTSINKSLSLSCLSSKAVGWVVWFALVVGLLAGMEWVQCCQWMLFPLLLISAKWLQHEEKMSQASELSFFCSELVSLSGHVESLVLEVERVCVASHSLNAMEHVRQFICLIFQAGTQTLMNPNCHLTVFVAIPNRFPPPA